jgi:hypothetical protein
MPNKKTGTGSAPTSLDYERGGHNPQPAKSKKRAQIGPLPTSAKPVKAPPTGKRSRKQGTAGNS